MPSRLLGRINLDLLWPAYLERFLEVVARCEAKGAHYFGQLGTRTVAEQDALYAQGRTKPGPKVTNAPGGMSLHNYGLAVDVIRDADLNKAGLQPEWKKEGYETLWREAPLNSLETGYAWAFSDAGHIQVPRPKAFKTDGDFCRALKKHFDAGGLKAVWAHLDATYKW